MTGLENRGRWLALLILCQATSVVLDVTIVGVALPSIRDDLGFRARSPGSSTPT